MPTNRSPSSSSGGQPRARASAPTLESIAAQVADLETTVARLIKLVDRLAGDEGKLEPLVEQARKQIEAKLGPAAADAFAAPFAASATSKRAKGASSFEVSRQQARLDSAFGPTSTPKVRRFAGRLELPAAAGVRQ